MAAQLKACVIVPTYNERENVEAVALAVAAVDPSLQVVFVDDSSPDGTADEVRRVAATNNNVHLLLRKGKMGLGSAHIDGFGYAMKELGAQAVVEMDSDLQHPPEKIPELVGALGGGCEVVVASRKVSGGGTTNWSLWRRTLSRGANLIARSVLGLGVKDSTSGFRALSRKAAEALVEAKLPTSSYSFQVASLFYLKKKGMGMKEIPFVFRARNAGKSKMGAGEIARFFWSILKIRILGF